MPRVASSPSPHTAGRNRGVRHLPPRWGGAGTGEGFFGTCATFLREGAQRGAPPVGAGNDPDARLLAPITQRGVWPTAPEPPSLWFTHGDVEYHQSALGTTARFTLTGGGVTQDDITLWFMRWNGFAVPPLFVPNL